MATDYESLLPVDVASEVISAVSRKSAVMALSRTITMPAGVEKIPVVASRPVAGFVNPAYGGKKPYTSIDWGTEQLEAEELAAVVAVPNAFIEDASFPVWSEIRDLLADAIAFAFDDAALNGDAAPASYPAGGLTAAAGAPIAGGTPLEALDAAMTALEAKGFASDGILGGARVNSLLRTVSIPYTAPTGPAATTLFGQSIAISDAWDYTKADEMVGDWNYSLVGVRQDIRYELSTDGVITDAAGVVIVNAFQDDTTLMRVYTRVGFAIGKPLALDGVATAPFEMAQAGADVPLASRSAGSTTAKK
jgi:hypothetical protein